MAIRQITNFFALIILAFCLASCAEEEQNRVLRYDKGTYLGKADQSLSSEQVRELMARSQNQRVY